MAQNFTTIDSLLSTNNITDNTNFLVTQYISSNNSNIATDIRQEYKIKFSTISSKLYEYISSQFNNIIESNDTTNDISSNIYNKICCELSSNFYKLEDHLSINNIEICLSNNNNTISNIVDAIDKALKELKNTLSDNLSDININNIYTKSDIDYIFRNVITLDDYLSSSADDTVTQLFQDDSFINENTKILLVNPNFAESPQNGITAQQTYLLNGIEYSDINEDTINNGSNDRTFLSNYQHKPQVKTVTLQAIIDYIKNNQSDMENTYNQSTINNYYTQSSEKLMHFRHNEYGFSRQFNRLSVIDYNSQDQKKYYATSDSYTVSNKEEELLIYFDVPIYQHFYHDSGAYAAIQLQLDQVDTNNTKLKKWVNIARQSLPEERSEHNRCSLYAHIIAEKGMVIRGIVTAGIQNNVAKDLTSWTTEGSNMNIEVLVDKDNYIGNSNVPINYTSYIYAYNTDKDNADSRIKRLEIFGKNSWLTAHYDNSASSITAEIDNTELSDSGISYNLKISYLGKALTKNTLATVRCALLDIKNPKDKELLKNLYNKKYSLSDVTESIYQKLNWFNLGFNYMYTNTSYIGEVLLGQYYFPNNIYVVLDIGLDKATTENTFIKVEYIHGPYSINGSNKIISGENNQPGEGYISLNTIQQEISNDNSLTTLISYKLSSQELSTNLSSYRKLSYGRKSVLSNNAYKKLSSYTYITNNEDIGVGGSITGVYIPNNIGIGLFNNESKTMFTFTNKNSPGGFFGLSCNDSRIQSKLSSSTDGILYGFAEKFMTQYVPGVDYALSIQDCIDTLKINVYQKDIEMMYYYTSIRFNKSLTALGSHCLYCANLISSIDFGNAQVSAVPNCFAHIGYNSKILSNYPQQEIIMLNKNVTRINNHINYDKHDINKNDLKKIVLPSQLTYTGDAKFCSKTTSSNTEVDVILPEEFDAFNNSDLSSVNGKDTITSSMLTNYSKSIKAICNNINLKNISVIDSKGNEKTNINCVSANLLRANDRSYTSLVALYYKNNISVYTINEINAISNVAY